MRSSSGGHQVICVAGLTGGCPKGTYKSGPRKEEISMKVPSSEGTAYKQAYEGINMLDPSRRANFNLLRPRDRVAWIKNLEAFAQKSRSSRSGRLYDGRAGCSAGRPAPCASVVDLKKD
jgi:hypothetical protein